MTLGLKLVILAGVLALALLATLPAAGTLRWNRATRRLTERLLAARSGSVAELFTLSEVAGLPEPVVRYFRSVVREGQPLLGGACLTQVGAFRTGRGAASWKPFRAVQHMTSAPPGFVWDARIRLAPGIAVRVRDGYVGGHGSMAGALFGLWSVVDQRRRPELDRGALQRYLAEAVWFPTALLPRYGVRWTAIDHRRALATLADRGTEASLEFRFNDDGEVAEVFTPERYREVEGAYVATPWLGSFRSYVRRDGLRVPLEGEVAWLLPEGRHPYWRGTVERIEHRPDRPDRPVRSP